MDDEEKKRQYLQMCEENEKKMNDRQEQYKQFFKKYDNDLDQRRLHHDMTVGEDHREKIRRQVDWETNGDKLYKAMEAQRKV